MIVRRLDIMSETEAAYLAGLIDGDGCLYVREAKRSPNSYVLYVHITCKEKSILDWVYRCVGVGRIKPNNNKHGNYWRWEVTAHKDVIDLAKRVSPYSVEKKRRWELLYLLGTNMRHKKSHYLTFNEIKWRDKVFQEFKSLQTHQVTANRSEFGESPERITSSQALSEEGVEVKPEIMAISAPPDREDMTRATVETVEAK